MIIQFNRHVNTHLDFPMAEQPVWGTMPDHPTFKPWTDMDDQTIEAYSRVLAEVAAVYHCTLEEYGPVANGVAWGSGESQHRQFEILTSSVDRARPLTVNDIGCGYGALFDYLDAHFRLEGYCGTDICEAMVDAAAARVKDPRARFIQSAMPVTAADWSFASGTFNISASADDGIWRRLTEDVLRAMARLSHLGFAFNLLRPERRDDFLWGAEPEPWQRFCQDELGGRTTLIDSADSDQWSLLVRRGG